jgi:voltage-gated potassium channel
MGIVRKRKYLVLITTLVGVLVVDSFTHRLASRSIVSDLLVTVIVLSVFLIVFTGRLERALALVATATVVAVTWSHYLLPQEYQLAQAALRYVLQGLVLAFAVVVILNHVLREKLVTTDEVFGAVCGYLLAAGFWANLYALTELFLPGSFNMSQEFARELEHWNGRVAVFDYFSLVTLTTMGYGDITPVRAPATIFCTLEAIFGQFYIAVLVAQLVGLRLAQALRPGDK